MTIYGRGKGGILNPFDRLIAAAGTGAHLTLPWSRNMRFWCLHVDDAAELFADLAEAETVKHTIYNAPSERLTIGSLADTVAPLCGVTVEFEEPGRDIDQVAGLDDRRLTAEFAPRVRPMREWAAIELAERKDSRTGAIVRTDRWNGHEGASASGYVLVSPDDGSDDH